MKRHSDLEYVVRRHGQAWTIFFGGMPYGRFPDRRAALESAVRDARRVRHHGHGIAVLVQRMTGGFRRVPDRLIDVFDSPIGLGVRSGANDMAGVRCGPISPP